MRRPSWSNTRASYRPSGRFLTEPSPFIRFGRGISSPSQPIRVPLQRSWSPFRRAVASLRSLTCFLDQACDIALEFDGRDQWLAADIGNADKAAVRQFPNSRLAHAKPSGRSLASVELG